MKRSITLLALAALLGACDGDDDVTGSSALTALGTGYCELWTRCEAELGNYAGDVATCASFFAAELACFLDAAPAQADVDRCVAFLEDMSCTAVAGVGGPGYLESCMPAIGVRFRIAADGESCEGHLCDYGLACHQSDTPGVCAVCTTERPALGEPCASSGFDRCGPGLYCEGGICVALEPNGEPCANDLACASGVCLGSVCAAPAQIGEACLEDGDCARTWNVCIDGTCRERKDTGESCTSDRECLFHDACVGGICAHAAGCERAAVGESCAELDCARGSYCQDDTDICVVDTPLGEPCASIAECGEDAYCDYGGSQVCAAELRDGESCDGSYQCADGLRCVDEPRTCQPPLPAGSPCVTYLDCADWVCDLQTHLCADPNACTMP